MDAVAFIAVDIGSPISALVGGARGKLLEALVRSDRSYSIREWARRSGIGHYQAKVLLDEFAKMGLVQSIVAGRSHVFTAVPESALRRRLQGLFDIRDDIVASARQRAFDAPDGVTVILFGSVARDQPKGSSDVDICIVGPRLALVEDWVDSYVATTRRVSGLPVNILRFDDAEWKDAVHAGERVVLEIEKDGIVLTPETL